VEERERVKK
jgi:hypothetical protein